MRAAALSNCTATPRGACSAEQNATQRAVCCAVCRPDADGAGCAHAARSRGLRGLRPKNAFVRAREQRAAAVAGVSACSGVAVVRACKVLG